MAREINGHAGSIPFLMTVFLKDVNDNPPRMPMLSPITIQAGNFRRQLVQVCFRLLLFFFFSKCALQCVNSL